MEGWNVKAKVTTIICLCAAYLCWLASYPKGLGKFSFTTIGWLGDVCSSKVYDGVVEDIEVGIGSQCIKRDQWQTIHSEPCRQRIHRFIRYNDMLYDYMVPVYSVSFDVVDEVSLIFPGYLWGILCLRIFSYFLHLKIQFHSFPSTTTESF